MILDKEITWKTITCMFSNSSILTTKFKLHTMESSMAMEVKLVLISVAKTSILNWEINLKMFYLESKTEMIWILPSKIVLNLHLLWLTKNMRNFILSNVNKQDLLQLLLLLLEINFIVPMLVTQEEFYAEMEKLLI